MEKRNLPFPTALVSQPFLSQGILPGVRIQRQDRELGERTLRCPRLGEGGMRISNS